MLRASVFLISLAICVSGFPPVWQSKQLPPCCKQQHGCAMAKRAAAQCALATCAREEVVTALKLPRAIMRAIVVADVPQIEDELVHPTSALQLTRCTADIDHPPRLLLA